MGFKVSTENLADGCPVEWWELVKVVSGKAVLVGCIRFQFLINNNTCGSDLAELDTRDG